MKLSDLNENDYQVESNTSEEVPLSLSSLSESDYQVESPAQTEQTEEVPLTSVVEQVTTPATGYMAGRTAQEAISKAGESLLKSGEVAAQKIGGLTPEQIEYYKQNYKAIEAGGLTPESIQKTMGELENRFKAKNLQATMALSEAERLSPTPLTREVAETAVKEALPELLPTIKTEEEPFQKKLKSRISEKQTIELQRLENLLKENESALINSKEYAQIKAEEAGQKALQEAKESSKKISLTAKPIDEKAVYNEAFDKALDTAKKEEADLIKNLESERTDLFKKAIENSQKDRTLETTEELLRQYQTELAGKYPSLRGRERKASINQTAIDKMLTDLSDVTTKKGQESFDFLRDLSKQGWTPDSGISNELAAKVREKLRAQLSPEGTLSDKKFKEVSKLLTELEAARSTGFIERITGQVDTGTLEGKISKFSPESVKIGQSEQQFIKRVLNPSAKDMQNVDIQEARGLFDQLVADPNLVDEVKQAAIKMDLLDPTKSGKFAATDAFRILIGTNLGQFGPVAAYEGVKALKTPMGAYKAATLGARAAGAIPSPIKTLGKVAFKSLPILGAGVGAVAAQAAEEALSPETSGATPDMPEYWLERGVRNPEEQLQKARLSSFKQGLPEAPSEIPSRFEAPEVRQRKEQVLAVKKAGALAPTYVEAPLKQVLKADNPSEIAYIAQSMQASPDRASQEYSRVLSKIVDAPASQKEAVLFGLNQQPAFREILKKLKDEKETEEEVPLMLKGPA